MMTASLFRLLAISAAVLATVGGCGRKSASPQEMKPPALPVHTARAVLAMEPRLQAVAGTVRSLAHAQVSARVAGRVSQADFTLGQTVAAGDTLVVLSADELNARVALAQAAFDQAGNDYAREASLLAKGASTAETVRTLDERRRMAGATLDETKAMLGYTRITAPFNGVVTSKFVNTGDLASAGTPLFELEGVTQLRAEVEVPESLATVSIGASLAVLVGDRKVNGALAEFSPASDSLSRTRLAKVSLPDGVGVHPGQFVRVLWPAGDTPLLTVPMNAVSAFGQMERVFVVTDGQATLRLVKTGAHAGDRVQILAGLDAGETIVLDVPATLRDGQTVHIQP